MEVSACRNFGLTLALDASKTCLGEHQDISGQCLETSWQFPRHLETLQNIYIKTSLWFLRRLVTLQDIYIKKSSRHLRNFQDILRYSKTFISRCLETSQDILGRLKTFSIFVSRHFKDVFRYVSRSLGNPKTSIRHVTSLPMKDIKESKFITEVMAYDRFLPSTWAVCVEMFGMNSAMHGHMIYTKEVHLSFCEDKY